MTGGASHTGASPAGLIVTHAQRLLLRAALLTGPAALDAWEAWRASTSVDALDPDSQWLLPQLFHNLHSQGMRGDALQRYRNVFLHNWYKNTLALRRVETAVARWQQAGWAVVLLGGAGLALRWYGALGARPFKRPHLLVRRHAVGAPAPLAPHADVDISHALHDDGLDDARVERADLAEWRTARWPVLSAADQVVHIATHRERWDDQSRLLWIADLALLLRHAPLTGRRLAAAAANVDHVGPVDDAVAVVEALLDPDAPEPASLCAMGGALA